jgi:hypothetical protein
VPIAGDIEPLGAVQPLDTPNARVVRAFVSLPIRAGALPAPARGGIVWPGR